MSRPAPVPIAIVGIGCRFPGGIDSPTTFWDALVAESDLIGPPPEGRFDAAAAMPDGGYIHDLDLFDAAFFGISPLEADRLDPQHRLLLETGWAALEDAGIPLHEVAAQTTGVYTGLWTNEYADRLADDPSTVSLHSTLGTGRFSAAGRLSYFLDARGPSLSVDTASSSSLTAVHLAAQSLRTGETDLALAGGANAIIEPTVTVAFGDAGMLAADNRCKFGAEAGDGYARSEGAAMIAMKRLDDAQAAGDRIYAVLRSSAMINEGRASGFLTRPAADAQADLLRRAYEAAGIDPSTVHYVEAHGTGTPAGDPVELAALGRVMGAARPADAPLTVGSVKSNLGHTEAAAGVAGLVKAALAIHTSTIPASLHVGERTDAIDWHDMGLDIATSTRPWPLADVRRAGVSSFGITGADVHVVLESAPEAPALPAHPPASDLTLVLPLSARSPDALRELAGAWAEVVTQRRLADSCAQAARRRSHHEHRAGFVADDPDALRAALAAVAAGTPHPDTALGSVSRPPRTVFVFSGQGSQWVGMARELRASSLAFRHEFDAVAAAVHAVAGWSPADVLDDPRLGDALELGHIVQPLLFAVQAGLAAQWRSLGVGPDAVVGHSMGEVTAAYVAGALPLPDAVTTITVRGDATKEVRGGRMTLVGAAAATVQPLLDAHERVSIAVVNSPDSIVISGDEAALERIEGQLDAQGVFNRRVATDIASHSAHMEPALPHLRAGLAGLEPEACAIAFYSTVDADRRDGDSLTADYWVANLRQPVRFGETIDRIAFDAPSVFIEVSPHPILVPSIVSALGSAARDAGVLGSTRREEPELVEMTHNLARAYAAGVEVDWRVSHPVVLGGVDLPTHPQQRERFWIERGAPVRRDTVAPTPDRDDVTTAAVASLRERLADIPDGPMRRSAIEDEVVDHLADVLRRQPAQIDRVRTFESQGLESLMAVEFRARLDAATGVELSATITFNHPTVRELAAHIHDRFESAPPDPTMTDQTLAADDVDAALAAELDAVERLLEEGR